MESLLAALLGLLIGSFLNVCIHRWPRDLSVVRPRSACPECGKQIAWYDNIPLLSYSLLRGRCRDCATRIPWRYPAVELATALSFAYFVHHDGVTVQAVKYCIFAAILIALIFSDLETLLLPDEFTLGGLVIGIAFAFFVPVADTTFHLIAGVAGLHPGPRAAMVGEALLGAILPAGTIWFGGWLFEKIRHREGLGFGDVKMLAMVGAFLGLQGALLTVIAGSIAGSIIGFAYIRFSGEDASSYPLPYGSFLGAAGIFAAIAGQGILAWYGSQMIR
jgi:leader peptidase (prepilin peptidase) / N-methyltransferase